ncbi:hypothetical protein LQE92_13630 [Lacrimispora sp. NSJ-141]|uniref:Uncharacterized protein n=1 Tax=Lientehia hominis TaxID=2897778 RepID=A0AAP2WAN5_9FIRM|nr:hypothetical protein [Lientehia hominis]MCD2493647.1 hypothetical protein [Lientehia hominis]
MEKALTINQKWCILKIVKEGKTLTNTEARPERKVEMDEEMNTSELLVQVAEENQTRKILELLRECKDLEEAKEKVKALLNK